MKREPTSGNLDAYSITRAKVRRVIRHSKKTFWRNYVSKMNSQTSVKCVWNRIYKVTGKEPSNIIHHLSVKSSSAFSTDAFASVRKKVKKQNINFSSDNAELQDPVHRAHDSSAASDEIQYQLHKHLPSSSLLLALNIFNKFLLSVYFPSD